MTQLDPIAFGLTFLPAYYLSAFVHEFGHAAVGQAAGYTVTSFGVGLGRPCLVFSIGGVKVFFGLGRLFHGVTFALHPQILPSRASAAAFHAGGVLFNAGLGLISFVAWQRISWGREVWLSGVLVNGVFVL